ncbi:hypothetical protein CYMTET_23633 [Cymbomonas tetramitiformis]|uniref:Receptor ligand binding region domain-containing protein n=1 Tax=Cymbomonas tetramitiformis TaxID=36881 RepID=A0AAE0FY29_9CHLO|nr:hypothetical protein CYMTET_23633 [Cymbomonas tetramitiformis]
MIPGAQLVFALKDSKCDETSAKSAALELQEWGAQVVVGPDCSGEARASQTVLEHYSIPQISGSASSASLSSSTDSTSGQDPYPWFMRTIPSDDLQARAMANLVHYYNWTRVVTIAVENDYGLHGIEAFHEAAVSLGILVAEEDRLSFAEDTVDFGATVQELRELRAYIFVMFAYAEDAGPLMEQAYAAGVGGEGYVWIGSEATAESATWESMSDTLSEDEKKDIMRGYLGVRPYLNTSTAEYKAFAERWRAQPATLDEESGECSTEVDDAGSPIWMRYDLDGNATTYDACIGMDYSNINDTISLYATYYYDAVYVVGHALHSLLLQNASNRHSPDELRDAMLAQSFVGPTGHVAFNGVGDRSTGVIFEVVNHAGESRLQHVGTWSTEAGYRECKMESQQEQECHAIVWSSGEMLPLDGSSCIAGAVFDVQLYQCEPCRAGTFHDTASDSCPPCSIGTVSVDPGATTCLNCRDLQATFYQDEEGQAECKDCPEGADCSSGVSAVGQKGYWRDSPERSLFYECFNPEDGTCLGESSPYAGQGCQEGHEGPLCSVCGADYARGSRYDLLGKCTKCSGDGENLAYLALIITGGMLFVFAPCWRSCTGLT